MGAVLLDSRLVRSKARLLDRCRDLSVSDAHSARQSSIASEADDGSFVLLASDAEALGVEAYRGVRAAAAAALAAWARDTGGAPHGSPQDRVRKQLRACTGASLWLALIRGFAPRDSAALALLGVDSGVPAALQLAASAGLSSGVLRGLPLGLQSAARGSLAVEASAKSPAKIGPGTASSGLAVPVPAQVSAIEALSNIPLALSASSSGASLPTLIQRADEAASLLWALVDAASESSSLLSPLVVKAAMQSLVRLALRARRVMVRLAGQRPDLSLPTSAGIADALIQLAEAVPRLRASRVPRGLVRLLGSSEEMVRNSAAACLAQLGSEGALVLTECALRGGPRAALVRLASVHGLGLVGPSAVGPLLVIMSGGRDSSVGEAAAQALARINSDAWLHHASTQSHDGLAIPRLAELAADVLSRCERTDPLRPLLTTIATSAAVLSRS